MFILWVVPKNLLSYLVGLLVHIPLPAPLSTWSVQIFASYYNINMEEAEHPIENFRSIGELFTRRLKPGVRPVSHEEIVHPADSELTTRGFIENETMLQAKGKTYSVSEFLNVEGTIGKQHLNFFQGGAYFTYYLCPTDYHRVHSPVSGKILSVIHIPGALWPVNDWSVNRIERLFAINERVVVWIETQMGPVAVVFVGATNVGKMTMSFDSEVVTNRFLQGQRFKEKRYGQPIEIQKGEELGTFHMGSTVVVLYPKGVISEIPEKRPWKTQVGEGFLETSS